MINTVQKSNNQNLEDFIKTIEINGDKIKYFHKTPNNFQNQNPYEKQTLIILPGYGFPASSYISNPTQQTALNKLIENNFEIYIPEIVGINYTHNHPISTKKNLELYYQFCKTLNIKEHNLIGHSFGAKIALTTNPKDSLINKIIAIDPPLPINYGTLKHILKYSKSNLAELTGNTKGNKDYKKAAKKHSRKILQFYLKNILRNPISSFKIIEDITKDYIYNLKTEKEIFLIYGKDDELFNLKDETKEILKQNNKNLSITELDNCTHNWPHYKPELFAEIISHFLK